MVAGCGEGVTRIQECELKDAAISDQLGTHVLDKLACRRNGTTGGNEVIDDKDAIAGLKGIRVDLERIGAVFEFVADGHGLARKLSGLTCGDEARAELQKLKAALTTPEVQKFLSEKYQGAVVPAF